MIKLLFLIFSLNIFFSSAIAEQTFINVELRQGGKWFVAKNLDSKTRDLKIIINGNLVAPVNPRVNVGVLCLGVPVKITRDGRWMAVSPGLYALCVSGQN